PLALARRPSLLKATVDQVAMRDGEKWPASLGVPDLDRVIIATAGEAEAVGAVGHAANKVRMASASEDFPTSLRVPDPDRVVFRGAGQPLPIWTEYHTPDPTRMSCECPHVGVTKAVHVAPFPASQPRRTAFQKLFGSADRGILPLAVCQADGVKVSDFG